VFESGTDVVKTGRGWVVLEFWWLRRWELAIAKALFLHVFAAVSPSIHVQYASIRSWWKNGAEQPDPLDLLILAVLVLL